MNLLKKLLNEALKNQPSLSSLKIAVEKELLHHDILKVMRDNNLTAGLTFIGGTCLRTCYKGIRLSEDLDFTAGKNFSRDSLSKLAQAITDHLQHKYDLQVTITEPIKDGQNVDTWKIKIETRPMSKQLPAQCISIAICSLPSYEPCPKLLLNHYGVDRGTSGLIIQAQSLEEIYTDKLIAFAFRPNRIKYRDLWDILWLHNQNIKPRLVLIPHKLKDRGLTVDNFFNLFDERLHLLKEKPEAALEFKQEMRRFLPTEYIDKTLEQEELWNFITHLMEDLGNQIKKNNDI